MRAGLGVTAAVTAGEKTGAARLADDCAIVPVKLFGVPADKEFEVLVDSRAGWAKGFAAGGGMSTCQLEGLRGCGETGRSFVGSSDALVGQGGAGGSMGGCDINDSLPCLRSSGLGVSRSVEPTNHSFGTGISPGYASTIDISSMASLLGAGTGSGSGL